MSASAADDCPFCSLAADRIIAASGSAIAIRDAFPVSPGHTLVLTRRHVPDLFGVSLRELNDILRLIRSVKLRLDRELHPAGYNIGANVGVVAGQTVMHVHVHVIPRYPGDTADPRGGVRHVIPGMGRYD